MKGASQRSSVSRLVEGGDELQEPGQADARDAADAAQAEAFEQQLTDQRPGVGPDALRARDELPAATQAAVVLLALVGVAVLLGVR